MSIKILKINAKDKYIIDAIISGEKKIETRAATPKYREVKTGDRITLVCGSKKIKKEVVKVELFKTIGALLKKYKPKEINPKTHSAKEARAMWYSFPNYEAKIKEFGLVAWHLK